MKLGSPKVFAREYSQAGEDNKGFENSSTALRPLLPSTETFSNGAKTPRRNRQSVIRSRSCGRCAAVDMTAFVSRCFPKTIKIPARFRDRPLEVLSGNRRLSARLAQVLHKSGVRVLGDLHRRRVGDFAWKRNCGFKTLQELDSLASAFANQATSRKRGIAASREASGTAFAVSKSICRLRFDELPTTKRLANVVRSHGFRTLGDLHGRTRFELLQYKACGWRTLVEVQQLVERAICGEFDVARIDESKAAGELLTLLEQGITKLAPGDRQFLLARIRGMTFAEIGLRYGFTRAWAHQAVVKAFGALRNTWGPRIPRLLAMTKARCFSIANSKNSRDQVGPGLTPALLEQWVGNASKRFRLSREAQLRLIAALDKNIPVSLE
jgi:hypothetical protein